MPVRALVRSPVSCAALVACLAGIGCSSPRKADVAAPVIRLGIAGAANTAPSIAGAGEHVVVVWAATTGDRTNAYAAVSRDGGGTFGAPVRVNDLDGDVRVSADQAPRVALGKDVVVTWTSRLEGRSRVRLARSPDGGRTFQPATTLHEDGLTGARGWASLTIDRADRIHSAWLDGRDANAHAGHGSTQGEHGVKPGMRQDIFHALWQPGGGHVEARVATDVCFCCKTAVATAPDGTTFVAWRHVYPTNLRDMAIARSTDGGRTFTEPVRVSEDGWQINACPEDGPSIAAGDDGVLHIAWPTMIQGATERKAVFYSFSSDGGRTFAPRIRVDLGEETRAAGHPQLTVLGNRVAAVWDENTEAGRRVRFREITAANRGAAPVLGAPITIEGAESAGSPAVGGASRGFVVAWVAKSAAESEIRVRRAGS